MDSLQLAQRTFITISARVTKVALERRNMDPGLMMDLGKVATSLCLFSIESTSFTLDQKIALEEDGRIREVLQELESVISQPDAAPAQAGFPTLCALAEAQRSVEEGDRDERDTARRTLNELELEIQERFNILASANTSFSNLISLIQKCSKIRTNESPDFTESTSAIDEPPEHLTYAKTLYDTLSNHVSCHCLENKTFKHHWAKLRLTPTQELASEGFVQFDMLFSASPDPSQTGSYEWQDVQMLVSRLLEDSPETEQDINSTQGATLGNILTGFKLQHGMRPVLAYILAKSVWQYYNSDWMRTVWTKDKIFFMEMSEKEEFYYFCQPYVSTEFGVLDKDSSEYFKFSGVMHRFPRVLALGIMLLEIGTGQSAGIKGREEPHYWDAKTVNEQWKKLKKLLADAKFEPDCDFPKYRSAVEKCLDSQLFKNAFTSARPKENLRERQSILYREVVDRLRQLVEGAGWDSEFDKMARTPIEPMKISRILPFRSSTSQSDESKDVDYKDPSTIPSQAWLQRIIYANKTIKKTGVRSTPMKIAILDTGCDPEAPSLLLPGRKKIKLWKDLVENKQDMTDEHGHGTHLATLILQIAPYAELCVIRVAKDSEGLEHAEEKVAEAIDTAIGWDADLVSMSFGFPGHAKCIEDAMARATARKKGITFFAAANNQGSNDDEMFPAKYGDPVLSIRGTDAYGSFVRKFSPATHSDERVFGTLGKDVWSDWISPQYSNSMSGSSVATAIGVGVAAMVLEYATRSNHFTQEELRLMQTRRGIFELFSEIGDSGGDKRYYIAPFKLFDMDEKDRLATLRNALRRHPAKR